MSKRTNKSSKKSGTVAAVAVRAILAGKGTEAVIAAVRRAFPRAKTTPACVAWYRHDLRKRGEKVPEGAREKSKGGLS